MNSQAPEAPDIRGIAHGIARFFRGVSTLASLVGELGGLLMFSAASSAPQEAAVAAMTCLMVIAPYTLARAVDELTLRGWRQALASSGFPGRAVPSQPSSRSHGRVFAPQRRAADRSPARLMIRVH